MVSFRFFGFIVWFSDLLGLMEKGSPQKLEERVHEEDASIVL